MSHRLRAAFTLVELLVVIAIIGILIGMLIPAVQYARECARRAQCRNNLHQIGIALHNYHAAHSSLPPGCVGTPTEPANIQGWGWGTLLLPHLEQQALYNALAPDKNSLTAVIASPRLQPLLRTPLRVFRCPSDLSDDVQTTERTLSGFMLDAPSANLAATRPARSHLLLRPPVLFACIVSPPIPNGGWGNTPINPGGGDSGSDPSGGNGSDNGHVIAGPDGLDYGVRVATSNYVGSFGDVWETDESAWNASNLAGNGAFGSNASVRIEDIKDGTSQTFAVGERSWLSYASIWAGTDGWSIGTREGVAMTLGTAHYRLNADPDAYFLSDDPRGAAGFGSVHGGGAYFLMVDGSVRFVSDDIDFDNAADSGRLGVFQRLAQRNDGSPTQD